MSEVNYQDWIGSREETHDNASLSQCQRFQGLYDDVDTQLKNGDPVPPMWHWIYFLPSAPQREIGPDGHPKRGGFLPPIAAPRRMFAGATTDFIEPIPIGADIKRVGEVVSITEKSGKTGKLIFVGLKYQTFAGDTLCMEESHNVVYREIGAPNPAPIPLDNWPELPEGAWSHIVEPDPVQLFRYSALTYNGHRIHYDRPYTMEEEGYPGLVVQGPFISTHMSELVRRNSDRPMKQFSFRAMNPIFDTAPFRVVGILDGDRVDLRAERVDGQIAQQATAILG